MKTRLQILVVVLLAGTLVGAWIYVDVRSDYTWSDVMILKST